MKIGLIKVFTAFSGYDSQCMALDKLGIDYELVGWSEIDKYAIQAHNAVYPQWAERNYGDISKIDWDEVPDFDLFTYSFPCTDISSAGKQMGLARDSGTRSSLLWECQKAIEIKRPKYCLMENVAALVSEKFRPFFLEWERLMCIYGYTNYNKVLNAKDYGIPQNRERIFMVSILDPNKAFYWPEPMRLEKRLKDVLEQNVDEKYYLNRGVYGEPKIIERDTSMKGNYTEPKIIEPNVLTPKRTDFGKQVRKQYESGELDMSRHDMTELEPRTDGVSNTLTSVQKDNLLAEPIIIDDYNQRIPQDQDVIGTVTTQFGNSAPRHGYKIAEPLCISKATSSVRAQEGGQVSPTIMDCTETPCHYEGVNYKGVIYHEGEGLYTGASESESFKRGGLQGLSRTLKASMHDAGVVQNYRIRKLTPRECFRLMGVSESDIDKIQQSGISNSQQYKMAGNSIVVDVLEHIFRKLFVDTGQESQQLLLF